MKREGEFRNSSGCAIIGIFNKDKSLVTGEGIASAMATMHERSNGLGGGFAGYGIYPEHAGFYAFHLFYDTEEAMRDCEGYLRVHCAIEVAEKIPTRALPQALNAPRVYRYFLRPKLATLDELGVDEDEFVFRAVMYINSSVKGAYVFSSGKNMGVFKGVGYPEDIAEFFQLDSYQGYAWTAHGRYPTNTPGWWGGAHPFALLDKTIVHNGEISSYGTNRRHIEMYGYACELQTDTEVITYILDFLERKHSLTLEESARVIAAPFWQTIESNPDPEERARLAYLRQRFSSLLVTGPFSIIYGFRDGMMALNDRLKLRSMVVGEEGESVYISSEECGIRSLSPSCSKIYAPMGGEPVIVRANSPALAGKA